MLIEIIEVSHTSEVSGASKFISFAEPYFALAIALFRKYDSALDTSIITRITKIHTSNCTCKFGSFTPSRMNVINATPVTPYVSNPSADGPTESPALSPVQSAITPGLRTSSSLILKTIFMRSSALGLELERPARASSRCAAPAPRTSRFTHGSGGRSRRSSAAQQRQQG